MDDDDAMVDHDADPQEAVMDIDWYSHFLLAYLSRMINSVARLNAKL